MADFDISSILSSLSPDDIENIKKVEKDMWCISVSALRQGSVTVPITFDYYVKEGDTIKFQRINNQMNKCTLKVLFICLTSMNDIFVSTP